MTVRDILDRKGRDVLMVSPEASVLSAVQTLNSKHVGALMVGTREQVKGILSERDVLRSIEHEVLKKRVDEIMTPAAKLMVGHEDDSLDFVMHTFTTNKVRHLPIVDSTNGTLVGILSIGDIVQAKLSDAEFENKMMVDYIVGSYG